MQLEISKEMCLFALYLGDGNYLQVKVEKDIYHLCIMFAVI